MFRLTREPIDRGEIIRSLNNDRAGALVVFEGWVRNHNEGKQVASLEYQVYEALAEKEGQRILAEAKHRFNIHEVTCFHRYGHLALGEAAVFVGATASHRDDAFKATRFVIDEIKLRLPIWKKEHYLAHEARWVFCRDHHTHVHFHENDYYAKQAKLVDQARLKGARVLVVGAGGLGCPVLTSLANAGVGHIHIADFDRISISNIHRQPLYSPDAVGEKKVAIAKARIQALNPFIHVQGLDKKVAADNVEELIQKQDLILDCTDNLETKFLLHDACFKHRVPLISASIYQFEGQVRTFIPTRGNGCLRCVLPKTPDDSELGNCNDFGVLGSSVGAIGSIQANEALLFLLSGTNTTADSTFYFNLRDLSQMRVKNFKQEGCETCAGSVDIKDDGLEVELNELSGEFEVVDIREREDSYLNDWRESGKKIVVCCYRGVRSKRLVKELRAQGLNHFYSLRGGACSL